MSQERIIDIEVAIPAVESTIDGDGEVTNSTHLARVITEDPKNIYINPAIVEISSEDPDRRNSNQHTVNWGENRFEEEHPDLKPDFSYLLGETPRNNPETS